MTAASTDMARPTEPSATDGVARAARGSALNMVGALTAAILSFVTVGLITNNYGDAGAGVFFSATAAFTLAGNATRLGSESGLTFFVSRLRAEGRQAAIGPMIRTALVGSVAVATAVASIGFVLAPRLADLLTSNAEALESSTIMIRVLAIAVPAYALSQAMFGASRGFGTMRPSVLAGQIVRPVSQLVLVAGVIMITDLLWPLAAAWALSIILASVPIGIWLRRRVRRIDAEPATISVAQYWRFAGPRSVADLLSAALERLDVLLVAGIIGEAAAGLYGASNRLILVGQLLMMATSQSLAPLLSAAFLTDRTDNAKQALQTVSAWNITLLWPAFIGLAFSAETALAVFGSEFTQAAPLVVVLSLTFLVITGLGVGDNVLLMTGGSVASLINHALALTVMVIASVILLPTVGIIGAAWAWSGSRLVLRGLATWRVWQTKRVHALGRAPLTAAASALVAYGPSGLAAHSFVGSGIGAIAVHAGAGVVIHLLLLLRFRQQLDLDQLLGVIKRGGAKPQLSQS